MKTILFMEMQSAPRRPGYEEMTKRSNKQPDARRTPRLKLPAMYTLIRVRPKGQQSFCWTGHIYDISASGLRFELDSPLQPGTEIDVLATLPGRDATTLTATGNVIRFHDDPVDDPGPVRMAMTFDSFSQPDDQQRLNDYLVNHGLSKAA